MSSATWLQALTGHVSELWDEGEGLCQFAVAGATGGLCGVYGLTANMAGDERFQKGAFSLVMV